MQLSNLVMVCHCHRNGHVLEAAGVMNTSVMCVIYTVGFKADPGSLIKLSITFLVHEFEGAAFRIGVILALNGDAELQCGSCLCSVNCSVNYRT